MSKGSQNKRTVDPAHKDFEPAKARKVRKKTPVHIGYGICRHCSHSTDEWPIRRANGKTGPGVVCCPACSGPDPKGPVWR